MGGIDNLLYSPDADFSCFADLALTSPWDYFKEGEGSLMQCVITPPGNGVVSGKDYPPAERQDHRAGRRTGARPVPFRKESRAQVGQRGQDRAEPVPGEAGHGRVPARPEDAHP